MDIQGGVRQPEVTALVGLSLRFPGQCGTAGFWAAAFGAVDVQREVPLGRWDTDVAFSPDVRPGKLLPSTR